MPLKKFEEIRERIDKDIFSIASSIDPRLHPQPILALTEFIKGVSIRIRSSSTNKERLCHL
jgi:hypothetical protein